MVVHQVMEALDEGDGVSHVTRACARLMEELGEPRRILARYTVPAVVAETGPYHEAFSAPDSALIFHYWGYNWSTWLLQLFAGRRALYYHNITPPGFFSPGTALYHLTRDGYSQLGAIVNSFDLLIGDSRYNLKELEPLLDQPRPVVPIYPVVDPEQYRHARCDQAVIDRLRSAGETQMVFVGRIARHKRQDRLLTMFDYYHRHVNQRSHLWLVGNDGGDPEYRAELARLYHELPSRARITFTGKVSDAVLHAYLRAADVFVCASAHEGFCIPIAQAMALDVPVVAYAAAAVPEVVSDAGLLVHSWDAARVAELVHAVVNDEDLRRRVVGRQRERLPLFSAAEARTRLAAVLDYLRDGRTSPLFEWPGASLPQDAGY
jgi:L-malate glycosyltransferase